MLQGFYVEMETSVENSHGMDKNVWDSRENIAVYDFI